MKKILLFTFLCLPGFVYAQAPTIEWQYTFGGSASEQGHNITATSDGGSAMAGLAASTDGDVTGNHGGSDFWVIKLDANGALQWQKSYGGTGEDKAYSIAQTSDGGYIVAGSTTSNDGDVSGNHGSADMWVIKLDASGTITWQKTLGGTSADIAYTVLESKEGGYGVFGLTASNNNGDVSGSHGSFEYWFCKLDASGGLSWQKCMGGSGTEQGFGAVQTDNDSGYVFVGYSSSTNGDVTGGHGNNDYWVVKIDMTGTLVWQHAYGGTGSDRGFNIAKTFDSGFIVNGISPSVDGDVTGNHGDGDYWVIKLDAMGVMEWQKSYGGTGEDFGRSVQQTIDSGYILGGRSVSNDGDVSGNHGNYDYWAVKLLKDGSIDWQQSYGGSANESAPPSLVPFTNIVQLSDGKYIMGGYTYSDDDDVTGNAPTGATDDNWWVVKLFGCPAYYTLNDTICPGHTYTFNGQDLSTAGQYYDTLAAAGGCDSILILNLALRDPIAATVIKDTICHNETYTFNAMQLNVSGTYYDTLAAVNTCDSIITLELYVRPAPGPSVTAAGAALSTGSFATYQWLLNGAEVTGATGQNYTAIANGDYQVAIVDAFGCKDTSAIQTVTGVSVNNSFLAKDVNIYPNPVKNQVNIYFPYIVSEMTVSIYSMDGKLLISEHFTNTYKAVLPFEQYNTGVYTVKITDNKGNTMVNKLVK